MNCVFVVPKPLADGAEAGLCGWTRLLRTLVAGQERFEIGALELGATIDDNDLWQASCRRTQSRRIIMQDR